MGVPCITLKGGCHAHNVGMSLLTAIGLQQDWVAHSEEQYVEMAVRHASDIDSLVELRQTLRQRMLESPLCDAKGFVQRLEGVYWGLWNTWLQQVAAGEKAVMVSDGVHHGDQACRNYNGHVVLSTVEDVDAETGASGSYSSDSSSPTCIH